MSRRGWVLFGALGLIWGLPYLLIKIAVEQVSPAFLVFGRVTLAAALLLPIAAARGMLRPLLPHWRWLLAFAAIEIGIPFAGLGYAEQRLSSSLAGLLIATVPLIGAVLATVLRLEDRLDAVRLVGLLAGLAGVAALVGLDVGRGDLLSVAAVGVTALGYAAGPVIVATRLVGLPSIGVTAVALGLNAVGYAPFAWLTRPATTVPVPAWAAIGVLGVLCSAIAFLLFFALVAEVGPSRTTVITYVNPAVALALGVIVLGEPVTVGLLIGSPLVLLGSLLATRRPRSPAPAAAPARALSPDPPGGR